MNSTKNFQSDGKQTPYFLDRFSNSLSNVATIRAPVQPSGWPIAMAPPFTLTLSLKKHVFEQGLAFAK